MKTLDKKFRGLFIASAFVLLVVGIIISLKLGSIDITFEELEFETEAEYWLHTVSFPYIKNAKSCKVMAIIIKSNNEKKNIELQFNDVDGVYCFEELYFGDYYFEMFDYNDEELFANDLISNILEIKQGNLRIINLTDLIKKTMACRCVL